MNLRNHARAVTMASIFALAALSIPATQAHALPKDHPQPNLCAIDLGFGDWKFYLPGEKIELHYANADGDLVVVFAVCGADGKWHRVLSLNPTPLSPASPLPARIGIGS